jgi:hypothetical protein
MLTVTFDRPDGDYLPGEEISGRVTDATSAPPSKITLELIWETRGKGDTEETIVESKDIIWESLAEYVKFKFHIPEDGPYSFSGSLISLMWFVQVATPGRNYDDSKKFNFFVSPTGKEIELPKIDPFPGLTKRLNKFKREQDR